MAYCIDSNKSPIESNNVKLFIRNSINRSSLVLLGNMARLFYSVSARGDHNIKISLLSVRKNFNKA